MTLFKISLIRLKLIRGAQYRAFQCEIRASESQANGKRYAYCPSEWSKLVDVPI